MGHQLVGAWWPSRLKCHLSRCVVLSSCRFYQNCGHWAQLGSADVPNVGIFPNKNHPAIGDPPWPWKPPFGSMRISVFVNVNLQILRFNDLSDTNHRIGTSSVPMFPSQTHWKRLDQRSAGSKCLDQKMITGI